MEEKECYKCAIARVKIYLKNVTNEQKEKMENYNAFDISAIMEIIFDIPKEKIIRDIVKN